ncbi:MAG: leucine-rich repeat domain-containing protein [Tidjanibacter sp.]|nr:leucine-rich repeat domain-containing protein [Tidjanibacter sp.]
MKRYISHNSINESLFISNIIPNGVEDIGSSAFANCSSLESITIPNSVKSIGSSAFANCSSLESITIPNSVEYIDDSAFDDCPLKTIYIDKDNKYAINYFKELGYKDNIKLIDNDVNESLSIPTDSSAADDYLYDMNYKKLVEERYDIIYSQLSENFIVSPKTNEKSIDLTEYFEGRERVNIIFKLTEDFEIKYKDEILNSDIIPNGVEKILKDTFVNIKQSIENINIPDSVDYISNDTFSNCSELKSIKLSEKLDNIPDRCFMNCIKLESIEIPDKVQTIGEYAFNNCKSLESITLSNNIYEIGVYAFDKCDKINEITIKEVIPNFKINDYIENHFKCYGYDIEIENA